MACKYLSEISPYELKEQTLRIASGKGCTDINKWYCTKKKNRNTISEYCFRYGVK